MAKMNKVCVNIDQSDENNGGFTDAEKAQARNNIGAGTSSLSISSSSLHLQKIEWDGSTERIVAGTKRTVQVFVIPAKTTIDFTVDGTVRCTENQANGVILQLNDSDEYSQNPIEERCVYTWPNSTQSNIGEMTLSARFVYKNEKNEPITLYLNAFNSNGVSGSVIRIVGNLTKGNGPTLSLVQWSE